MNANTLPALAMNEDKLIQVMESSLYPGASPQSIGLVLNYCKAAGLDPMQKPAHIVPMWDSKNKRMRDVIMPGVGLYRTQAARTGQYAGVTEPEYGPDVTEKIGGQEITYPAWCKVSVKRLLDNGTIVEFAATERWKENYAVRGGQEKSIAPNAMWLKRPYGQIAKCAEAQALRKAFPEMIGSQQTAEEMEGREIEIHGQPEPTKPENKEVAPWDDKKFASALLKHGPTIVSGTKTVDDLLTWLRTKAPLTETQEAQVRALKADPAPIEGEFMTEAEVEAARQREMDESQS